LIRLAMPSPRTARIAAVVWGLFLLALTSWPSPPEAPGVLAWVPDLDKFVHSILYGVEGYLLFFAIRWPEPPRSPLAAAVFIGGILAVWGTLDELHQAWIPGRSMEGMDALTDALAGFSGGLAAALLSRRLRAPEAVSPRS
jgi:VanZ family protein